MLQVGGAESIAHDSTGSLLKVASRLPCMHSSGTAPFVQRTY